MELSGPKIKSSYIFSKKIFLTLQEAELLQKNFYFRRELSEIEK